MSLPSFSFWLRAQDRSGELVILHALPSPWCDRAGGIPAAFLYAHFDEANLQGAHFDGANLEAADLGLTRLQRADLRQANLRGALLSKADLKWAKVNGANFQGVDLSETVGLTQEQLDSAQCDERTKVPAGLTAGPKQRPRTQEGS